MSCDGLLFFINAKLYSLKIGALGEGTPGLGQDVFQMSFKGALYFL